MPISPRHHEHVNHLGLHLKGKSTRKSATLTSQNNVNDTAISYEQRARDRQDVAVSGIRFGGEHTFLRQPEQLWDWQDLAKQFQGV